MRVIVVPDTKNEIRRASGDVTYELKGRRLLLDDGKFKSFWEAKIVDSFYKRTGKLIDDFETTIIEDDKEVSVLMEIIESSSFSVFYRGLKSDLLSLVHFANEKKSGIVFFF
jgi:hypothetical protein